MLTIVLPDIHYAENESQIAALFTQAEAYIPQDPAHARLKLDLVFSFKDLLLERVVLVLLDAATYVHTDQDEMRHTRKKAVSMLQKLSNVLFPMYPQIKSRLASIQASWQLRADMNALLASIMYVLTNTATVPPFK